MAFDLSEYVDVAERITIFRAKYPDGSLQPLDPARPFWIESVGEKVFVCYAAAAYRSPDDQRPGVGLAWEPFPGKTPYTRDSEVMVAETSAWGRAIVAALAADTKKIASTEEVQNRSGGNQAADSANAPSGGGGGQPAPGPRPASAKQLFTLNQLIEVHGPPDGCPWPLPKKGDDDELSMRQASAFLDVLKALPEPPPNVRVPTLRPVDGPVDLNDIADYSGGAF